MSDLSSAVPMKDRPQIRLFKAVARADTAIKEGHRAAMKTLGLKLGEFDVLAALGNTDGMRMSELAERVISSPSSITRLCVTLESRNLVRRTRSPVSDREVIASLTAEGQALFERTFLVVADFTRRFMDSGLSPEEQEQAAALLLKFLANLKTPDSLNYPPND